MPTACVKRTGAAASAERRRCEYDRRYCRNDSLVAVAVCLRMHTPSVLGSLVVSAPVPCVAHALIWCAFVYM